MKIICFLIVTITALILLKINAKKGLLTQISYLIWVITVLTILACFYWLA